MTIDDLIARLEEYRETWSGDAVVRLMTQAAWPFENAIHGLVSGEEMNESEADGDDVADDAAVYIVEGQQLGCGSKRAWNCTS